jgi:hypothetical protein
MNRICVLLSADGKRTRKYPVRETSDLREHYELDNGEIWTVVAVIREEPALLIQPQPVEA